MERQILWTPWNNLGLEHLRLVQRRSSIVADGVIIRVEPRRAFRATYRIRCDAHWRARDVRVGVLADPPVRLRLHADGEGHWRTAEGESVRTFDRCVDLDLSASAFTNTLAIRRLGLETLQAAKTRAAYVQLPELRLQPLLQRYTCLAWGARGGRFRYEALRSGFAAELRVDAAGLVIEYPPAFRRVWARAIP